MEGTQQPVQSSFMVIFKLSELVFEGDVLVNREVFADPRLLDEDGDTSEVFERRVKRDDHLNITTNRIHADHNCKN